MPNAQPMSVSESLMEAFLWIGALLVLGFGYGGIGTFPGFHYDEAWSANHAYRIAFEPGFWPWGAQSPYTSSILHYSIALVFRLVEFFGGAGVSIEVFRMVHVAWGLFGLWFVAQALRTWGYPYAARLTPVLAAAIPSLVLNFRFGIELTSFHLACAGGVLWSLAASGKTSHASRIASMMRGLLILVGVSSHALFLAVPLALGIGVIQFRARAYAREAALLSLALSAYCAWVALHIPEADKGLGAAMVFGVAALTFALWSTPKTFGSGIDQAVRVTSRYSAGILNVVGCVALLIPLFLLLSDWPLRLTTGEALRDALVPWQFAAGVMASLVGLCLILTGYRKLSQTHPKAVQLGLFLVIALALVRIKPTPRYDTLSMIFLTMLMAVGFECWVRRYEQEGSRALAVVFGVSLALVPGIRFLDAASIRPTHDAAWNILGVFKDGSQEFLNFQRVMSRWEARGCVRDDLFRNASSVDSRLYERLKFWAMQDTTPQVVAPCHGLHLWRRAEPGEKLKAFNDPSVRDWISQEGLVGWLTP